MLYVEKRDEKSDRRKATRGCKRVYSWKREGDKYIAASVGQSGVRMRERFPGVESAQRRRRRRRMALGGEWRTNDGTKRGKEKRRGNIYPNLTVCAVSVERGLGSLFSLSRILSFS